MPSYDFKLYQEEPGVWVPVMWAKQNIDLTFTAPDNSWEALSFKVFQVFPDDPVNSGFGGAKTAEEVKAYIWDQYEFGQPLPAEYELWDPDGTRYVGSNGQPTFKLKVKKDNSMTIDNKHNRNEINGSDPVYDFLLLFNRDSGSGVDPVLVDPRLRNEY